MLLFRKQEVAATDSTSTEEDLSPLRARRTQKRMGRCGSQAVDDHSSASKFRYMPCINIFPVCFSSIDTSSHISYIVVINYKDLHIGQKGQKKFNR